MLINSLSNISASKALTRITFVVGVGKPLETVEGEVEEVEEVEDDKEGIDDVDNGDANKEVVSAVLD